MKVRFLADANLDQDIVVGLLRREPEIDFELPQGLIPEGMDDPEVLELAASLDRILVTHDVRTMPRHFARFIGNRSSPGVVLIPKNLSIGRAIEELLRIHDLGERCYDTPAIANGRIYIRTKEPLYCFVAEVRPAISP